MIPSIRSVRWLVLGVLGVIGALVLAACGGDEEGGGTLYIGGIPDQDVSALEAQFGLVGDYLADETGLTVEYVASNDYAALVTAFQRGDVHLAWFGGLTGVQARAVTPDAEAIAQRPRDAEFTSVFIVNNDLEAETLEDLRGATFTFGSESSTSGHLMPRHYLLEAGVDAEADFDGQPGFSGSHDATYALVDSGAFQAGVLNEAVWEAAVRDGGVDTDRVRVLMPTPPYYDYNWTIRGDVDETLGEGTREAIVDALLAVSTSDHDAAAEIMETFGGSAPGGFIATENGNYQAIEEVARTLGIIQ